MSGSPPIQAARHPCFGPCPGFVPLRIEWVVDHLYLDLWYECFRNLCTKTSHSRAPLVCFPQMRWIRMMSEIGAIGQLRTKDFGSFHQYSYKITYFSAQTITLSSPNSKFLFHFFYIQMQNHLLFYPSNHAFQPKTKVSSFISIFIQNHPLFGPSNHTFLPKFKVILSFIFECKVTYFPTHAIILSSPNPRFFNGNTKSPSFRHKHSHFSAQQSCFPYHKYFLAKRKLYKKNITHH